MNQGKQANKTGRNLEHQIKEVLVSSGYNEIKDKKLFLDDLVFFEKVFSIHCYIGNSIYGTKLFTDIILYHPEKYPNRLAIEIKWQQVSGSVDEKFPYIIENVKKRFPCPAIIILDGDGYKLGAKKWLEDQIDNKFLGVYSLSEFIKFTNNGGM